MNFALGIRRDMFMRGSSEYQTSDVTGRLKAVTGMPAEELREQFGSNK